MSREKQIEEMACAMCGNNKICVGEGVEKCILYPTMWRYANNAYREGYRKQSEGEWKPYKTPLDARQTGWICSNCSSVVYDLSNGDTDFCPNCGAKMKGGAE